MSRKYAVSNMPAGRGSTPSIPASLQKIVAKYPLYNLNSGSKEIKSLVPESGDDKHQRTLPSVVSASDVREVIQLLRRKPEGVKLSKALLVTHKRIFELKKIHAYEKLRIIKRENQSIRLSPLGWKFVDQLRAETRMFRTLLLNIQEYRAALKWMVNENNNLITVADISLFWKEYFPAGVVAVNNVNVPEKSCATVLREEAVTFFHICQAADFGTMTLGKRGRITRLLIDSKEIEKFVTENIVAKDTKDNKNLPAEEINKITFPMTANDETINFADKEADILMMRSEANKKLCSQVEVAFDLANISFRKFDNTGQKSLWSDEKTCHLLANSRIGCILIGENEIEDDLAGQGRRLKDNVLCEIGAAMFSFCSRLILISTAKFDLPDTLAAAVKVFQIKHGDLSWETARELVDKVKEMNSGKQCSI